MPVFSEVSDKLLRYVERTFARAFEFVQALRSVRDIYDLTKLQEEFIEAQISAMTELVRDFGGTTAKPVMRNLKAPTSNAAQVTLTLKNLAAALAERHGMARKRMEELLDGAIALVAKHLKKGDRIRISGLGTLQVRNRAARMGRNPASGNQIAIKARKTVAFCASKDLNESPPRHDLRNAASRIWEGSQRSASRTPLASCKATRSRGRPRADLDRDGRARGRRPVGSAGNVALSHRGE